MAISFPDADRSRIRPALVAFRGGGYARCDGSGAGTAAWAARNGMIGKRSNGDHVRGKGTKHEIR